MGRDGARCWGEKVTGSGWFQFWSGFELSAWGRRYLQRKAYTLDNVGHVFEVFSRGLKEECIAIKSIYAGLDVAVTKPRVPCLCLSIVLS